MTPGVVSQGHDPQSGGGSRGHGHQPARGQPRPAAGNILILISVNEISRNFSNIRRMLLPGPSTGYRQLLVHSSLIDYYVEGVKYYLKFREISLKAQSAS